LIPLYKKPLGLRAIAHAYRPYHSEFKSTPSYSFLSVYPVFATQVLFAYSMPLNFQSAALAAIKTLVQPLKLQRITLCKGA